MNRLDWYKTHKKISNRQIFKKEICCISATNFHENEQRNYPDYCEGDKTSKKVCRKCWRKQM